MNKPYQLYKGDMVNYAGAYNSGSSGVRWTISMTVWKIDIL